MTFHQEVNQGQIITLKNENKNVNSINNLLHTLMTEFQWAKPIIGDHGKCIMFGGKICLSIRSYNNIMYKTFHFYIMYYHYIHLAYIYLILFKVWRLVHNNPIEG